MILDLFAGPGGWSEGLRMLGLADVGIEWDAAACATRAAAGHRTIRADVAQYPTEPLVGKVTGLIASPPCQDFSMAGKRAGRSGEKGQLIDEVPRWVDDLRPEWFACEQVPPALEVWEEFAYSLRELGYSTWAGVLNAADFGVPQTRKRAILIGSRVRAAVPPTPTHAKVPQAGLFGSELPWVSMASALGWGGFEAHYQRGAGMTERHGVRPGRRHDEPAPTLTGSALGAGGGAKLTLRAGAQQNATVRSVDEPAPTITSSMDNGDTVWVVRTGTNSATKGPADRTGDWRNESKPYERSITEPAPTVTGKAGHQWMFTRPATTVAGDPRITARCHHDEGSQGSNAKSTEQVREGDYEGTEPIKLTVSEALILQSFDPAYPVQGTKTKQFEQIGNAVCPLLAAHIIAAITGTALRTEAAA